MSAARSRTSSRLPATRATSPSGCTRMVSRARSSSRWPRKGPRFSGLMDSLATMTSLSLQYGVPLRDLVNKFSHMRFEPAGFTGQLGDPDRQVDRGLRLPVDGSRGSCRRTSGMRWASSIGTTTAAQAMAAADAPGCCCSWPVRPGTHFLRPLQRKRIRRRLTSSGRPVGPKRRRSLRNLLLQKSAAPTSPSSPTDTRTATPTAMATRTERKPFR